MIQLTREQKIQNYQEILEGLKTKKKNLEKQIAGIEAKLSKLENYNSQRNSSEVLTAKVAMDRFEDLI